MNPVRIALYSGGLEPRFEVNCYRQIPGVWLLGEEGGHSILVNRDPIAFIIPYETIVTHVGITTIEGKVIHGITLSSSPQVITRGSATFAPGSLEIIMLEDCIPCP